MVSQRMPVILGQRRPRPVDAFREVIGRYSAADVQPAQRLPNRDRLVDALTEQVRPLLEAIVDAEAASAEVERLVRVMADREGSAVGVVARFELVRARDLRNVACGRLRELLRDEKTLLRYLLLRQLVRFERPSHGGPTGS